MLKISVFLCSLIVYQASAGDLGIREGDNFYSARQSIISSGWSPLKTYVTFEDGSYQSDFGEAVYYKESGITEIESCAGTGLGYCFFNYKKNNTCLQIVTEGMFDSQKKSPVILRWRNVDCESLVTQKKAEPPPLLRK